MRRRRHRHGRPQRRRPRRCRMRRRRHRHGRPQRRRPRRCRMRRRRHRHGRPQRRPPLSSVATATVAPRRPLSSRPLSSGRCCRCRPGCCRPGCAVARACLLVVMRSLLPARGSGCCRSAWSCDHSSLHEDRAAVAPLVVMRSLLPARGSGCCRSACRHAITPPCTRIGLLSLRLSSWITPPCTRIGLLSLRLSSCDHSSLHEDRAAVAPLVVMRSLLPARGSGS